jgi:hypothetical protein
MNQIQTRSQGAERGQTEPLAALVAVALFCLALSVYAAFVTGLIPDLRSDRQLAEVTGERVWEAVSEDGIYPADVNLSEALDPTDLPRGHQVAVNVTYLGPRGYVVEASRAGFDERGAVVRMTEPPDGDTFRRPVPVQHRAGDVRPGLLTVVVSDGD